MLDEHGVPLGRYTTLRLGGAARHLIAPRDQAEIIQALRDSAKADDIPLVLAGGSNIVVGDAGVPGTVLLIRSRGYRVVPETAGSVLVTAEAGHEWDDLVGYAVAEGLAGLESMSGIPGSVGGTPIQNVGAYGHEVAEVLAGVRVYDRRADRVVDLTPEQCGLGFRTSVFKRNDRHVVLAVTLRLRRSGDSRPVRYAELARTLGVPVGARVPAEQVRSAVLGLRAGKGMVLDAADPDTYSVGSFFQNPVLARDEYDGLGPATRAAPAWPYGDGAMKLSAAALIERAGFGRGYTGGHPGVGISGKHTLALTNRGTGTTTALLDLAREIRDGVDKTFGVRLFPEAVLVNCEL